MLYKRFRAFVLLVVCLMSTSFVTFANNRQKKIIVNNSNVLVSFTETNCNYVIIGVVNLSGKTVQIPSGCVLDFRKGSITNGVLTGNNTQMKALHKKSIGFRTKGTWIVPKIDDAYFDSKILTDDQIITAVNTLQSDSVENRIILRKGKYNCSVKKNDGCLLRLSSNTKLKLKTIIAIAGNNYKSYNIIRIKGKENVEITGGVLIGDVGMHVYVEGTTSQWGHGIYICNSKHVKVKNITVMRCIGDGFTITGGTAAHYGDMSQASSDVLISKVVARYNRRQGISLIYAENVTVKNSEFSDTGIIECNSPSAGMDIEPNLDPYFQTVCNVKVKDCRFERNVGASVLSNHYQNTDGIKSVSSVILDRCYCDGRIELHTGGFDIRNTRMSSLDIYADKDSIDNLSFTGCKIKVNGINLNCINKKRGETGIYNLVFNRCKIFRPQVKMTSNEGLPIARSGKTENIGEVTFNNCKVVATK